ncbi:hypothetical protein H920_20095 [Fukomys damarensis]|uniref:Uncharacterized protein n=1 Tax=Fukomys damarensis TaxID=885580 RepID=A0A091D6N6_FUKDA|nr:hypothetical protein H920_20095 [Fukomys damarensis]
MRRTMPWLRKAESKQSMTGGKKHVSKRTATRQPHSDDDSVQTHSTHPVSTLGRSRESNLPLSNPNSCTRLRGAAPPSSARWSLCGGRATVVDGRARRAAPSPFLFLL